MDLPQSFLTSLQGLRGFDEAAFVQAHALGEQITSVRVNPLKTQSALLNNPAQRGRGELFRSSCSPVPWSASGCYLSERPSFTFDPFFHAGCYYVQEASSMFVAQALEQVAGLKQPLRVLDLCAAPGGKSTHIQSLITAGSMLVSNEVIRSRTAVLRDNLVKWGSDNVMVTNNDAKDFAALPGFFDVILVDAPCSGSGLFRRDAAAIKEWSADAVTLCSQRQQRILADVMPALANEGLLIYATCSYSKAENEDIMDWLSHTFNMESLQLKTEDSWGVTEVRGAQNNYGYRFWPHRVKGEGFFLAVFRKTDASISKDRYKQRVKPVSKRETAALEKTVVTTGHQVVSFGGQYYAWPARLFETFDHIAQKMRVIYSGVRIGELMRDKLVPDHALAMSALVRKEIPVVALDEETAIRYLQKKEFSLPNALPGWQLAAHAGYALGWMNVLPRRINNYYPRELRILKER